MARAMLRRASHQARKRLLLGRGAIAVPRLGILAVFPVISRSAKQIEPPAIPLLFQGGVAWRHEPNRRVGEIKKAQLFHWTDKQHCKTTVSPLRVNSYAIGHR